MTTPNPALRPAHQPGAVAPCHVCTAAPDAWNGNCPRCWHGWSDSPADRLMLGRPSWTVAGGRPVPIDALEPSHRRRLLRFLWERRAAIPDAQWAQYADYLGERDWATHVPDLPPTDDPEWSRLWWLWHPVVRWVKADNHLADDWTPEHPWVEQA